jgi:hypothetical protein
VELQVAIVSLEGRLLKLDVRTDTKRTRVSLGSFGDFDFPLVPEGKLELRVGIRDELEARRALLRHTLLVAGGKPVALVLTY